MKTKKIKKSNFNKNKNVFKVDDIDVNKILVSKKEPYGTNKSIKYFIGYNVDNCYQTTSIKRPQIIGYVKCFDSNKTMSFKALIKNRWNVILKYGENSAI